MRVLYILLEVIGLVSLFMHVLLRTTGWSDINLLHVSLLILLVGSFFEGIYLREKIKNLEIEIAERRKNGDK